MCRALIFTLFFAALLGVRAVHAEPAVVIDLPTGSCGMFDGDGGIVGGQGGIVVVTNSQTGRKKIQCTSKDLANSAGQAVHYDTDNNPFLPGLQCGIRFGGVLFLTTDWMETVSASGNGTLTCKFKD